MNMISIGPYANEGASALVAGLKASGGLDELFAKIGASQIEVTGDAGIVPALIKETP